jgi:hypothetical protein
MSRLMPAVHGERVKSCYIYIYKYNLIYTCTHTSQE